MKYRIKNWDKFQHYKDRNPPWIKLHVEILASADWVSLADASKLLAIVCMIIGARSNGVIEADPAYFKRVAYLSHRPNFKPLIECGFLEPLADASNCSQMLASACTEQSRVETEQSISEPTAPDRFNEFWLVYPKKVDRGGAIKAWKRAIEKESPETIIAGARAYAAERSGQESKFTKQPETWLNKESWGNSKPVEMPADMTPERIAELQDKTDRALKRGKYAESYS